MMGFWDFFRGKRDTSGSDRSRKKNGETPEAAAKEPRKEDLVGEVEGYFRKPHVAVIRVKKGPISANDRIWIKGHTTDMTCLVQSMQIDHKPVERAEKGQCFGLQVKDRVRRGDGVYRTA